MALTPKQEAFAQAVVAGLSLSDAYRKAFTVNPKTKPESVNESASRLMADLKVASRVQALRKPVVDKLQYGLEEAMEEAADALRVSKLRDNGGAMVAAITLRSKLMGLLIERKVVQTGPLDGMEATDAQALIETIDAIQRARSTASQQ